MVFFSIHHNCKTTTPFTVVDFLTRTPPVPDYTKELAARNSEIVNRSAERTKTCILYRSCERVEVAAAYYLMHKVTHGMSKPWDFVHGCHKVTNSNRSLMRLFKGTIDVITTCDAKLEQFIDSSFDEILVCCDTHEMMDEIEEGLAELVALKRKAHGTTAYCTW